MSRMRSAAPPPAGGGLRGPRSLTRSTPQAYLSSLALKLQLLSQDMHDSIQDSMSQLISGLPRHARRPGAPQAAGLLVAHPPPPLRQDRPRAGARER